MTSTRRVTAGAVTLEVAEAGSGGRPLLLVHGFCGAKEDFTDHLDDLGAGGWHAVAVDLRGHGNSDHPPGEEAYDLEQFAGDVWALVDALGWTTCCLLGHSMGGMVAQVAALRHPDRVRALVLMDTSSGPPEGIDAGELDLGVAVVREHGMATLGELQDAREDPLETSAARRLREERPGWEEFGRRKFLAASGDMWAAMAPEMVHQQDRIEELRALSIPVLVIVGEQDRPFLGPSERMAKAIPGARLVVIPDAGHSPQFENPDAWWQALTTFLGEVE
jgi:pimeloyl-ACP methyl ester carboxylesterase